MSLGNVDLSRELVQAVREAADILSVASDHTRLAKKGRDYQGLCPLHKEKTPSFHVDPDRGLFYCFGCNAGGDAIKLHMLTTGDDFPAAIEALALRYGVPVRERTRRRAADEPDTDGALAAANGFFRDQLARHEPPRRYLAERKVPPELVERFEIGYAPDGWTGLYDALKSKVRERDLEAAGLIGKSSRGTFIDRFRHRLMFPVHNAAGRLVGFGGRTLGDDQAKYVNTAETERFHKGELLYGLFQARRAVRDGGRAVLVEGYFDVIGAVAAGVEGAVATMGTALTPEQARLLARYAEEVVVAYDGDSAGEHAHVRALPILLAAGLAVYRARFPEGHDPDSLRLAAGPEAVARAVAEAKDSVVGEIERRATPETRGEPRRQAKAASDLGGLLGRIPDEVLRYTYARRAAERLDLPVEVVMQKVPGRGAKAAAAPAGGAPGAAPPAGARGPGRDVEEKLLRLLLGGFVAPAPTAFSELPPPDAFLDPLCRRLYEPLWHHWRDLGEPCTLAELFEALSDDEPAHAALARLAIEMGDGEPASEPLGPTLSALHRRHAKRRRADLQRSIDEAHRAGDGERLDLLLRERDRLAAEIHPGTRGSVLAPPGQKGEPGRVETE